MLIHYLLRQTESLNELRGVGFSLPAVELSKFCFQFRGFDAVLLREVLLGVESVLFLHYLVEPGVAHDDCVKDGILVIGEVVLLENAKAFLLGHNDLTGSGFELAAEHTEEGRLSCAVCADNAVAVAVCEF